MTAFADLMQIEGGYVHDPLDRGGETRYGISARSYPDVDIANLTLDDAAAIYRRDYWDALRLGEIADQKIAAEVFDSGVNTGTGRAALWLQQALNLVGGFGSGIIVPDGKLGPKTVAAVNNCRYGEALLKALNGLQFLHYYRIVEKDPTQARFIRGWLRRVWEER
jgi:lysozyme family protein